MVRWGWSDRKELRTSNDAERRMNRWERSERIVRLDGVFNDCLEAVDDALEDCDEALKQLQPYRPGRITLLKTHEKSASAIPLNTVRWRIVRWRIRHENSDGSLDWETQKLPLRGASRMALGRFQFHDTQAEVRKVIKVAVEFIEWRARLVAAVTNYVTALEAHERTGMPRLHSGVEAVRQAVEQGARNRADAKALVEQVKAVNENPKA